ncbi:alpha/beta hydrolase [Siphonobacter sp. SORGH_AS_0500]|uniref:alpha/beta fold hydrolase n=1 Tax=Siphonobacter sp. SORGH_AS_0500 TaxID=1864824 RepID=UPI0028625F19|nr:alpha/beta hydrolase [Siphonobacter sp. SORGH_AS_0500]MDR6194801.1 pimeloyl-ACP methyl ester carboxylesterase [Siphonobacter sp. SORGH_AS_0500]
MITPLILLHGYGEDAKVWDTIKAAFWPATNVLTPSYASRSDLKTIDEYAEAVYKDLRSQGVERGVVIGHSMGGYIALALAEKHPEFIEGLGLFHSTAYADTEEKKANRDKNVAAIKEKGPAGFLQGFVKNMYSDAFAENNPGVLEEHITHVSQLPPEALIAGMQAMKDRPDRRQVLEKATYPVLFIIGMKDKAVKPEEAMEQVQLTPNSSQLILEKAGHMGMTEEPDDCLEIIQSFWQRVEREASLKEI